VTRTATETVTQTETAAAAGLPEPVEAKRAAILEAAESADHEAVAALASDQFSYTFGGPVEGGPAAFWRQAEANGDEPLESLARILRMPYTLSRGLYVWPFAYDRTPDELTPYEEDLLAQLPGGGDVFTGGGYLGWRAGIEPNGDWVFFVAGD
jgi:hypothetical protein